MKHGLHSHCNGEEVLPRSLQAEISLAIAAIAVKPGRGAGRLLRESFLTNLRVSGWSSEVAVAPGSYMTVTSMKHEVGLCLQTGNMARMYADLMKLQTLYLNNAIKSAAIVIPSEPLAKVLGCNIAQAKRLARELAIFKKAYHVPTVIFSLE